MNKKYTILGGFALFALVAGVTSKMINSSSEGVSYVPYAVEKQSISGAMEHYFNIRKNNVTGEMDEALLRSGALKANEDHQRAALLREDFVGFEFAGPSNAGGRIRGLEFDPTNANVMYAGGVSGGMFKSTDGGNTWMHLPTFSENYAVSCIEVMNDGQTVYVGTGNSFEAPSSSSKSSGFFGSGLFKSSDAGATWTKVATVNNNGSDLPYINAIEKTADGNLIVGASNLGAYLLNTSTDQFTKITDITLSRVDHISSTRDGMNILVSGKSTFAANGKVLKSMDGGASWTAIYDEPSDRTLAAFSEANLNYIYVLRVNSVSGYPAGITESFGRTTDGGATWTEIFNGSNAAYDALASASGYSQGMFDAALTASPTDPNVAFIGGVRLFGYKNGSLEQIATQANPVFPSSLGVHSDIHAFNWDSEGNLYICTDGGIYYSENEGTTYGTKNRGLNIAQFWGFDYGHENQLIGGTQDNGNLYMDRTWNNYDDAKHQSMNNGGDGFTSEISFYSEGTRFITSQYGAVERYFEGGLDGGFYDDAINAEGTAHSDLGPFKTQIRLHETPNDPLSREDSVTFFLIAQDTLLPGDTAVYFGKVKGYPQYYIVPNGDSIKRGNDTTFTDLGGGVIDTNVFEVIDTLTFVDKHQSLFAVGFSGTQGVYLTRDAHNPNPGSSLDWWKVIPSISGSVSALEFSDNGDILFVGTSSGAMYRVRGLDSLYTDADLARITVDALPSMNGEVGQISVDHNDPSRVFVVNAGTGASNVAFYNGVDNYAATPTKQLVTSPGTNIPVYSCLVDKVSNALFLGTEFGLYYSTNNGATWLKETDVENVPVFLMRQITESWNDGYWNEGRIILGTHGRGLMWSNTGAYSSIGDENTLEEVAQLSINVYPNPAVDQVNLAVNNAKGAINVKVFSLNGKLMLNQNTSSAQATINVANLIPGVYLVAVTDAEGNKEVAKLIKK